MPRKSRSLPRRIPTSLVALAPRQLPVLLALWLLRHGDPSLPPAAVFVCVLVPALQPRKSAEAALFVHAFVGALLGQALWALWA